MAAEIVPGGDGRSVTVKAGTYVALGKTVNVPEDRTVALAPPTRVTVKDEPVTLTPDGTGGWTGPTLLKESVSPIEPACRRPESLVAGSLSLHAEAGGGAVFREGADYALDAYWSGLGLIRGGAITEGQTVYADYQSYYQRVDLIQADAAGRVTVKAGEAKAVCPVAPAADPGWTALATVYVPARDVPVASAAIMPLPAEDTDWRALVHVEGRERLAGLRARMAAGEKVVVACWGDSVTTGATVSRPELAFVPLAEARLRALTVSSISAC
jgi:hypothetical protein